MSHGRALQSLAAAAAGSAMLLAGCSGTTETSAEQGTNTLEVMSWWTSASEAPALKVFTDAFAADHPGVSVANAAVAGGAGSQARVDLAKRLLAGDPPDIWQTFDGEATGAYVRSGQIRDISSVFSAEVKAAMNPAILDAVTVNGKQYAMPTGAHRSNVLFFNTAALEQAGVAAPGQGYTPAQFRSDLEKVKASGGTALCLGAKDAFTTVELFENALLAQIGADGWQKLRDDKFDWGSAAVTDALNDLDALLGYADADASDQSWDQAVAKLADGGCAFLSMNDSAYGELVTDGADAAKVGEVPFPGTGEGYLAVVDVFVAATRARNAKNALGFLATVADPATNLEFNKIKGSVPVMKNVEVSGLSTYQKAASEALWAGPVLASITHGEAMNPAFTQGFFDGVNAYVRTRDSKVFASKLSAAVNSYRPAGH